jgi:hypothetical protein
MDLPQPPQDPELKTVIDKLAQFVASKLKFCLPMLKMSV